jgi:hypothetical protein
LKKRAPQPVAGTAGTTGKPRMDRSESYNSTHVGGGIPDDPEKEFSEFVNEAKEELEKRRRRGSVVPDFRVVLKEKVEEWKKLGGKVLDGGSEGVKVE